MKWPFVCFRKLYPDDYVQRMAAMSAMARLHLYNPSSPIHRWTTTP